MKLILIGPPGSGKGTQGAILCEKYNIPEISTGAIIRNEIRSNTELGTQAKKFIDEGKLVPDSLIIDIIKERLSKDDCKNGYILDGFPRTIFQAEELDRMGIGDYVVLNLEVADEEILSRLGGRRECPSCHATYHVTDNPPKTEGVCNECGTQLIIRDDDKAETIQKRLEVYHTQTKPLKEYYSNKGVMVTAYGQKKLEDTTANVEKALAGGIQ